MAVGSAAFSPASGTSAALVAFVAFVALFALVASGGPSSVRTCPK
jgi:hypothetical protein